MLKRIVNSLKLELAYKNHPLKTGNTILTVVPMPNSESTITEPRCSLIMLKVVDNPKPVPFPGSLVVKKGSKIFGKSSLLIP
jgi:hypothetical protein